MFKKILAIAIVGLLVPSISQAASFENNLTYGAKNNDDVRELQEFLKDQKLFTGPITGNYFSLTRSAVIRFQQKNGVKPANGQFTTSSREIAQKLLDPEQDVTEPISEPSTYLDYPIGTTLQSSAPVVGGQTFDQTLNTQTTPTVIYYPVFVPQETTGTTSTVEVSSTPVVEVPKDTVAPKLLYQGWTSYRSNGTSWSRSLVPGTPAPTYGNMNNSCANCVVVVTDEPTIINLEYIQLQKTTTSADPSRRYEVALDNQNVPIAAGPVQTWNDGGRLSNTHIFITKPLFAGSTSTIYTYRFSLTDTSGNIYKERFTGSYQVEIPWSNGRFIEYISDEDPNSPSQFYTVIDDVRTNY